MRYPNYTSKPANIYTLLQYNANFWRAPIGRIFAKFWLAPIGRNRSRDVIVSLLSGRLSAHSARFFAIFAQNLALYSKNNRVLPSQALYVIRYLGNLMFKLLRSRANACCEHQISSGNLSHYIAFDRRTLLFK